MFKKLLIAAVTLAVTAGCNDEKIISEEFYFNNKVERLAKVEYCENNPDEKLVSKNCLNALSANANIKMDAMTGVAGKGIDVDYSAAEIETATKSRTKQYYMNNNSERISQVNKCIALNDAKKWSTPNCGAALAANAQVKALGQSTEK